VARVSFGMSGAALSISCRASSTRPVSSSASATRTRPPAMNGLCGYRWRSSVSASSAIGQALAPALATATSSSASSAVWWVG
jgi:hypothetical protein